MQSFVPYSITAYKDLKVSFLSFHELLRSSSSGRCSEIRVILFWRKFLYTIFKIFVPGLWHLFNMMSRYYMTSIRLFWSLFRTSLFFSYVSGISCRKRSSCHFILIGISLPSQRNSFLSLSLLHSDDGFSSDWIPVCFCFFLCEPIIPSQFGFVKGIFAYFSYFLSYYLLWKSLIF